MIQAAITGERQVAFHELPDPQPKADWAVVKVPCFGALHRIQSLAVRPEPGGHWA